VVAENVRFLDRAKEAGTNAGAVAGSAAHGSEGSSYGSEISFNEDDIPF